MVPQKGQEDFSATAECIFREQSLQLPQDSRTREKPHKSKQLASRVSGVRESRPDKH